ncbi:hypothetical protein [Salinicoccus albus]|uniref:hypothetical protein n=1 Tax=Salinicoccus albus TaxID=418756 RepID=UPI0003687935|nr:hypothetical protein [Salinicoccus albus]
MKQSLGESKIKFTSIVRKVDDSCDVSEKNIRLDDRHILLNKHGVWTRVKAQESNL